MSNIFAQWTRNNSQRVPFVIGTGPIVGGYKNQHLWFTDQFAIECVRDGVIHHYGDALPFDINGRLVISENAVDYWDQDIPFTALRRVAVLDAPPAYVDQGIGFADSGHICGRIDTIVIPGEEWFKEFPLPPDNSVLPIEDFQLFPAATCISVQLVMQLKVPWASVPNFHSFFNYGNAGNDRFRPEKNTGEGSWAIPADLSGVFTSQLSFTDVPLEGETFDFRWTLKPTGEPTGAGYRGWLDQVDLQSNASPTEFDNPLTHVSWLGAAYFNLIALRINHTCDISDTEIINWPNYNPKPPSWSPIPDQFNYDTDLPDTFDVSPYASSVNGPLVNWSLVAPPVGFSIDASGIITAAAGANVGVNNLVVRVENDTGAPGSDGALEWTVQAGEVPLWSVITDIEDRQDSLPKNYDVSGFVSSPSSPITGYSLIAPPTGFSIDASGVITAAAGTTVAAHALTVQATNATGSANSAPFTWTILEPLLEPEWSTIPNQAHFRDELPQTLDASLYVTSNAGPLTSWSLSPIITGFSIDSAGVITATQDAAEQLHTMAVTVNNDSGPATSADFTWDVGVFRLPPQWETIPNRSDRVETLPQDYDVSGYVSTNSGPLVNWVIDPPVAGFVIDQNGVITAGE